ncbi:hypothetical protein C2G38_2207569 [Gigaspora rosea]|uniref:Uncharacterized protein n=1 Tax=Gigaspora rosea TaxID=44941 RepID=A0A397UID6_9GLOM|nr:hypothetical protein C2G38_2207569 [Gigaspora rosea]
MTPTSNFENQFEDSEGTLQLKVIFELLTIKGLLGQLHTATIYKNNAKLFDYIQQALQNLVSTIPNTGYKTVLQNKEEDNNLDKEEKNLLEYFEEKQKNEPLLNERIKQIQSPLSRDGQIVQMAKTLSQEFRKSLFEPTPFYKSPPIALRFGTSEQQDVSVTLKGFLQNWQKWQQTQSNQDPRILQRQNNPFFFEIIEAQKGYKEKDYEVYEYIRKIEKQIYDIFKEYERMNDNFNAQWYYPIKMKIINGNQQEELQSSTSTKEEEEEETSSRYTFLSENIEEINKFRKDPEYGNFNEEIKNS